MATLQFTFTDSVTLYVDHYLNYLQNPPLILHPKLRCHWCWYLLSWRSMKKLFLRERVYLPIDPKVVLPDIVFVHEDRNHGNRSSTYENQKKIKSTQEAQDDKKRTIQYWIIDHKLLTHPLSKQRRTRRQIT